MIQKIAERSVKPKIRLKVTQDYKFVNDVVQRNKLHTVCEEARCPNMYECWDRGTATIMILGALDLVDFAQLKQVSLLGMTP